jgi:Cys-tRNA(Pro) deacylase
MDHEEIPITKGVRLLREKKIEFRPYFYRYEDHGGTTRAAVELGAPEHAVVKTLVMETDAKKPFLVLMHGDREVSTKQLARILGVKSVSPCDVAVAQRHTGYQVGGISPFGTRSPLPVYAEKGIFALPRIWINGGRRGFLVEVAIIDQI